MRWMARVNEVIEVNNINVEGQTPNDVLKILQVIFIKLDLNFVTRNKII